MLPLGCALVGTALFHQTQLASGLSLLWGNRGDCRLLLGTCEHWYRASLGQAALPDPRYFYPAQGALAYTDLLVGYTVPYVGLRWLGVDWIQAFQVVILLVSAANFLAAYLFMRALPGVTRLAACAGGWLFAFNSPRFGQLDHLQNQLVFFFPLTLWGLLRGMQGSPRAARGWFAFAALMGVTQLCSTFSLGWFALMWLAGWLLLAGAHRELRGPLLARLNERRQSLAGAVLVGVVGLIPFLLLYLPVYRDQGGFDYGHVAEMIPQGRSLLIMGSHNYLWHRLQFLAAGLKMFNEHQLGLGLIVTVVWLALTAQALRGSLVGRADWSSVTVLSCSLWYVVGMTWLGYSPWWFVYQFVPGAGAIRAVGRYVLVVTLPMGAVLAWKLSRTRRRLVWWLVGCALLEQLGRGVGFPVARERAYLEPLLGRVPATATWFYVTQHAQDRIPALEAQVDAGLVAILTGIPTVNGYSGRVPPGWHLAEPLAPEYRQDVFRWTIGRLGRRPPGHELLLWPPVQAYDADLFAERHYQRFLGRFPSPQERQAVTARLKAEAWLAVSQEFFLNQAFQAAGREALRRTGRWPPAADFQASVARLRGQHLAPAKEVPEITIALAYYGYLNRAPDVEGLQSWLKAYAPSRDPSVLVRGFLESNEYYEGLQR